MTFRIKPFINFLRFYLFFFRGEGKERERNSSVWLPLIRLILAHNPGMCPDWESNPQPFHLLASTQSTEPHQPGIYKSLRHRKFNTANSISIVKNKKKNVKKKPSRKLVMRSTFGSAEAVLSRALSTEMRLRFLNSRDFLCTLGEGYITCVDLFLIFL